MPSYSIGFCVARTRNGGSSTCVVPSIETWRSCIASSSAACVFGGARLISSAREEVRRRPGRGGTRTRVALVPDRRARDVGREQVGRELDAGEAEPGDRANDRAVSVFASPGTSSSSTWPSASSPRARARAGRAFPTTARSTSSSTALAWPATSLSSTRGRSRSSTARSIAASGSPGAARSSGAGRSGRTSSQTAGPTSAARVGASLQVDSPRSSSPRRSTGDGRQAVVDVERRARCERDLALHALEGPRAGARRRRGRERGVERRRAAGTAPWSALEREPSAIASTSDEPDVADRATRDRGRRRGRRPPSRRDGRRRPRASCRSASLPATPASCASRAASAAASSSLDLLERLDRLVLHLGTHIVHGEARPREQRRQAPRPTRESATSSSTRSRYSSGASAVAAREAGRGERALHPRVRADHRPPRVALRAEVVERLASTSASASAGVAGRLEACPPAPRREPQRDGPPTATSATTTTTGQTANSGS